MDKRELINKMEAIRAASKNENRPMNADEIKHFDELWAELESVEETEKRDGRIGGMKNIAQPRKAELEQPRSSKEIRKADARKSEEYRNAFHTYMVAGRDGLGLEARTLNTMTGSEGGFAVPEVWDNVIQQKRQETNLLRQFATQAGAVRVTGANTHITTETAVGAASIIGETESVPSNQDPTFGRITLGSWGLKKTIKASIEEVQDAFFDEGYIMGAIGRSFGVKEYSLEMNGNADGDDDEPTGLITAAVNAGKIVETASETAIVVDDLADFLESIDSTYLMGAKLIGSQSFRAYLRKQVDKNDRPLWDTFSSLWEYDLNTSNQLGNVAAGNVVAVIYNPAYFMIVDRGPITVVRRELDDNALIPYTGVMRFDCQLTDTNAVYVLKVKGESDSN